MNNAIENIEENLAEEIQAFKDLADDFAAKELFEAWEENDKYPFGELFTSAINNAGEVGLFRINFPVDYSGIGTGTDIVAIILERLSLVDPSMAGIIFTTAAALQIINEASADSDCTEIYKLLGEILDKPLAFQSNTSPDEIEIPVIDSNNNISGKISYCVLGGIAGYAVIPAIDSSGDGDYFSWYLIDLNNTGISTSGPLVSLGLHACPAVDITMKNVPAELIGKKSMGKKYFDTMRAHMSVAAAAMSLGIMKGSLREALDYTNQRQQGGRAIINWPQVRMMLANMAIEVTVGESCLAMACQELSCMTQGWQQKAEAAAIHLGELATMATTDGVQLLGGNGYTKDYAQEKRMRDAKQVQSLLGMLPLRKVQFIKHFIEEE